MVLAVPAQYACPNLMGFAASAVRRGPGVEAAIARDPRFLNSLCNTALYDPAISLKGLTDLPDVASDYSGMEEHDGVAFFGHRDPIATSEDQPDPRVGNLENDPTYKQPIPYGFITWSGQIACYRRPSKNAEARLAGKRSLGFGGHVEPQDLFKTLATYKGGFITTVPVVCEAFCREVKEEVGIDLADGRGHRVNFLGWINHDYDQVGTVHLGLVFQVDVCGGPGLLQADEIEGFELLSLDDAYAKIDEFETWSQFILRWLKGQEEFATKPK